MKQTTEKLRSGIRNRNREPFWISLFVLLAMVAVSIIILWPEDEEGSLERLADQPTTKVRRGPLTINVTESGTINPREQIILKNETDRDANIVFVVPEGTIVEKGELVVELDSTELENSLDEQRLSVLNDESDLVAAQENLEVVKNQNQADIEQAELDYKFAKQDLKKYKEGEYPNLVDEANASIKLAEAELKQAEEELKWSRILHEEKYLSQSELQQDELTAQKAQLDLKLAKADLELLEEYTYNRQVEQLKSDVHQAELALERSKRTAAANLAQAEANLKSEQARLIEEKDRLRRDEQRFEATKIYAPISGRVLYATSVGSRWRRNDEPIDVGTEVDQRDDIIYLPTASEYNAELKITEVDLDKVQTGLPARVTVDARPDQELTGQVTRIADYPDQDSRYMNPNLKLYEAVVELDPNEAGLRNGMSCQVEIRVKHFDDAVYVPIQSVTRRNGTPTVYVVDAGDTIVPREVEPGLDNARFVRIRNGLEEGERILLAPPLEEGASESEKEEGESNSTLAEDSDQSIPENAPEESEPKETFDS